MKFVGISTFGAGRFIAACGILGGDMGTQQDAKLQQQKIQAKLAALEKSFNGEIAAAEKTRQAVGRQADLRLDAERTRIKDHYRPLREALEKKLKAAQRAGTHIEGPAE